MAGQQPVAVAAVLVSGTILGRSAEANSPRSSLPA